MKVWVIEHMDYGYVMVYSGDTDPLSIPQIRDEINWLDGNDGDAFIEEVEDIKTVGFGEALIDERLKLHLTEVRSNA